MTTALLRIQLAEGADDTRAAPGEPTGPDDYLVTLYTENQAGRARNLRAGAWLPACELGQGADRFSARGLFSRATSDDLRLEIGEQLFALLLRDDVAVLWQQIMSGPRRPERAVLCVPTGLRGLPWELLAHDRRHLFRNPDLPWSLRFTDSWQRQPPPGTGPLRVLVVVAEPMADPSVSAPAPTPIAPLLADEEIAAMGYGLAERRSAAHVEVLDGPTDEELLRQIAELRPHVLHVIAHGAHPPGDSPVLPFNRSVDPDDPASARHPRWSLDRAWVRSLVTWVPPVVVLNACRTGDESTANPQDNLQGLLTAFLDAGSSGVVTMQADLAARDAVPFSRVLYSDLAHGLPLDSAVARARTEPQLLRGLGGAWGQPRLVVATPPIALLPMTFPVTEDKFRQAVTDGTFFQFAQLTEFVGHHSERRMAWWSLDPREAGAGDARQAFSADHRLLVITGAEGMNTRTPGPGKSWLTRWSLLTWYLRGYRVTYVDLEECGNVNWLRLLKAIWVATSSRDHMDPLPPEHLDRFVERIRDKVPKLPPPFPGEHISVFEYLRNQRALDDLRGPQQREELIVSTFVEVLREATPDQPHIIAFDHLRRVDATFDVIERCLIHPIASGKADPLRIVITAPDDWLRNRLPATWGKGYRIELDAIPPAKLLRLAREFHTRRNEPFGDFESIYRDCATLNKKMIFHQLRAFSDSSEKPL
ncbi:putative CHAT domain-containing protein [Frankia sp. AiPs1]|uniref:CHAT domain-containing protein n=1 Tax=Frankia sp. AiPa1 TaxID=573492 RepID=UPI00202B1765|nr:CHAT domain-containing protein [Frankia sp. AiPa1]MCL9760253.1 CHAT domain-containing protein [Frankia sp. AiPa1]